MTTPKKSGLPRLTDAQLKHLCRIVENSPPEGFTREEIAAEVARRAEAAAKKQARAKKLASERGPQ